MFKSHAQERAEQRYNLQLRGWELRKILDRISDGLYIKKIANDKATDKSEGIYYFYVLYKNIPLKLLANYKKVITIYPLDVDEYNKIIEERQKVMLIKCMTPTCAACKKLSVTLNQLGIEYQEVDILENTDIVKQYNIKVLPTLINENGEKLEGIQPVSTIKEFCGVED